MSILDIFRRKRSIPAAEPSRTVGLSYEAVKSDRIRRQPYYSTKSEDRELTERERQLLISQARDALRNFTIAGFALRKHLQSMSFYRFQAGTPDDGFNRRLEALVRRWKRRSNCDAAGRHNFDTLIGLIESHRAVDGDVGILRLSNGKIQIVEGDRIRNPSGTDFDREEWVHGVKVNAYGRALAYSIHKRKEFGGFEPERVVSAKNFDLLGFYTREDQIRGESLMAPAVRFFQQLYDSIDLALAKQRLEQAFGLAATLEDTSGFLPGSDTPEAAAAAERENEFARRATDVFGPGIMTMTLRPGEDVKFLESQNPSQNFQSFCENVIRLVFAAFDIPYSFYDGSKTNFYGSEGEFEQYIDSVEKKQQPTIEMLNEWIVDWLLPNWILDGLIDLPQGWTVEDIAADVGWMGAGMPSWRLFRNVKEILLALQSGLLPPSEIVGDYGYDIKRNLQDIARLRQAAAELGVSVPFGQDTAQNVGL